MAVPTISGNLTDTLDNPVRIIIFGSSYVRRLSEFSQRGNLRNFGINTGVCRIQFFGYGGLLLINDPHDRVRKFLDHLSNIRGECRPDMVVIHVGSNDIANGIEVVSLGQALLQLARTLQERFGLKCVVISQLLPRHRLPYPEFVDRIKEVNLWLSHNLLATHDPKISFWIHRAGLWRPNQHIYLPDGVHFSSVGNNLFMRSLRDALLRHIRWYCIVAGCSSTFHLKFAIEYITIRIQLVQAHQQLLLTCNTFRTSPPPAIASALAASNGQDSARWSQIITQLEKCVQEYEDLSVKISELHWSSFDADSKSLENVDILQQSCDVIKSSITTIVSLVHTGVGLLGDRRSKQQVLDKDMDGSVQMALQQISYNLETTLHTTPISDMTSKIELLSSSAKLMLQATHPYPRYFFQTLQYTAVKLAVSPQQNVHQEPISVRCDTHMTLKVEGVIHHSDNLFRQVKQVTITTKTILQSRSTASTSNTKMNEVTSHYLTRTVEPHNDYFCVNFLLPFPILGIHGITIEAAIVDDSGAVWNTGPKETLTVKSYDDTMLRQQQASRFQRQSQQQPQPH